MTLRPYLRKEGYEMSTNEAASPRRALRTVEAARYLGVSAGLLRKMRLRGPHDPLDRGPPCIKLSSSLVVYEIVELDKWLDKRRAGAPAKAAA